MIERKSEGKWQVGGTCGLNGHEYPDKSRTCKNCDYTISPELFDRMMREGY